MEVGIIGGGAAGMFAAICLAKAGITTTILEKNDRVGKKILATGNGKCNLGNENICVDNYYSSFPELLQKALQKFGAQDTLHAFQELGLMVKNKNGLFYPVGEQASIVLDILRFALTDKKVNINTEQNVINIVKHSSGKYIVETNRNKFYFDRIIIATGGFAAPKTGSDGWGIKYAQKIGHKIVPTVPALVQLRCKETYFKSIAGVRTEAKLMIDCNGKEVSERGELQITDYGISGIPVFQVSRQVNYRLQTNAEVSVNIDLFPDYCIEELRDIISQKVSDCNDATIEELFTGFLNKKLMLHFVKQAGLKTTDKISTVDRYKLYTVVELCKAWKVIVVGSNSYESAQVTAGGVCLSELTAYLESKKYKGMYFIGEVVDVDGLCGGFNLHWAWCSGYLASEGIKSSSVCLE